MTKTRLLLGALAVAMLVVALACAGEKATPTTAPTATLLPPTATVAPTATALPTALPTATLLPGEPTPTATAVPTATATAVPEPTATAVPLTWIERYLQSPGYRPEWGQPVRGGVLKYGGSHNIGDMNPNGGHTFEGPQFLPSYNALLRIDPWVGLGAVEGDLAYAWEFSEDFLSITLKLHEGVLFHDNPNIPAGLGQGTELHCDDAKASFERHAWPPGTDIEPRQLNSRGASQWAHLDRVTCPEGAEGYTMVLHFKYAVATTMSNLSAGHGNPNNMPREFIQWLHTPRDQGGGAARLDSSTPANFLVNTGTGAFVPVEYQPDIKTVLRRNPTYWREGLPLLDQMDQFVIKDFTARFAALATGQVHYFGEGSASMLPGQVAQAERDFKGKILIDPALHSWGKGANFNLARTPFDDVRVRWAVQLALDRDAWMEFKKAGSYQGELLAVYMPPGTYWAIPEEELLTWPGFRQPKTEDVAEANRLLDEVFGKGKRFKMECATSSPQMYVDQCLFFKDQMKRHLNIEVALDILDPAASTERMESGRYDLSAGSSLYTISGDPSDDYMKYVREYISFYYAVSIRAAYELDPVLMTDIEEKTLAQNREMDPAKRREMVHELEWRIYHEVVFVVPYGWSNIFPGLSPKMRGWNQMDFGSQVKDSTQWERVWLAK